MKLLQPIFTLLAAAVALLSACSSATSEGEEAVAETPLPGSIMMGSAVIESERGATRAASDAYAKLYPSYGDFCVWTWKSIGDNTLTVMDAWQVKYDIDRYTYPGAVEHWGYDGLTHPGAGYTQTLQYWDLTASRFLFSAYAPASYPQADGKMLVSGNVVRDDDFVVSCYERTILPGGKHATNQDLYVNYDDDAPERSSDVTALVPLRFHHVNSQIEFRVYLDGDPSKGDMRRYNRKLESLSIGMNGASVSGTVDKSVLTTSLASPLAIPAVVLGEAPSATQPLAVIDPSSFPLRIPVVQTKDKDGNPLPAIDRTAACAVTRQIVQLPQGTASDPDNVERTFTVEAVIDGAAMSLTIQDRQTWLPGRRYIYYLVVNPLTANIQVNVDVEQWIVAGNMQQVAENW